MKRIFVLCIALVIVMSAVASAEVKKGIDSFTGESYVSSWQEPHPFFKTINFSKNMFSETTTYTLSASYMGSKDSVFGDAPFEIKIDEYPICKLTDYRYKLTGPDSYGVKYYSVINIIFPDDLALKIKDAKKIAIRYEDARGIKYPYTLPDYVLSEWKEVINTEE